MDSGCAGSLVAAHEFEGASVVLRSYKLVLGATDAICHQTRTILLVVESHLTNDVLDERLGIRFVIDGEMVRKTNRLAFIAQDAIENAVESSHPKHGSLMFAHQLGYALSHLSGSLVGKGESKDGPRLHMLVLHQVGYLIGEHARLARPCAGNHQRGGIATLHRSPLSGVQSPLQLPLMGERLGDCGLFPP